MTKFMVKIAMNAGVGGGGREWGISDSGDFFESRVSRRDIWKI